MHWLKNKKQQIIIFLLCFILIFLTYFVNKDFSFYIDRDFSEIVFWVLIPITIFSFIFIFIKSKIWILWFKFSFIFSLISFFMIIFSPTDDGDFFISTQSLFIILYNVLYSLISLGIIIYHSFKKSE